MKQLVFRVFVVLSLASGTAFAEETSNRFNVLFIAVDDLRPELGCYGSTIAQSPNLDDFAKSAVLFNRHYVQVATCGASRYALLSGRSPGRSGVTRNNAAAYSGGSAFQQEQQPGAQTLPELFRRSGYHTVNIGKISHTPDGRVYAYNGTGDGRRELPGAWDQLATPFGPWKRGWGTFFAYAGGKHREDGGGNLDLMQFTVTKDDDLPDGLMATTAIEKLKEFSKSKKPFFLGLGFFKPHLPFVAPKQDWEAFAGVDTNPPTDEKIDSPHWHRSGEFFKYKTPYEKTRPLSQDAKQTARRAYLACVRYADRQIGRVLKSLSETGLADNTVVVIWGDHGWHLGEQQIWAKHTPFERANRSVLMVRAPGVTKGGMKTNALAETIDIYPTLIDLCRPSFRKTNKPLDGVSLVPLLTGKKKQVRDTAISYWGNAISLRTNDHRLIVSPTKQGKNIELYDLKNVPDERLNIAGENENLVAELLKKVPSFDNAEIDERR